MLRKFAPSDLRAAAESWADRVEQRTATPGLLAVVLSDLASKDAIRLTTDGGSRSIVTVEPHTPPEEKINKWFRLEARLTLSILSALQPAQVEELEGSIAGDDRKLLATGAV